MFRETAPTNGALPQHQNCCMLQGAHKHMKTGALWWQKVATKQAELSSRRARVRSNHMHLNLKIIPP